MKTLLLLAALAGQISAEDARKPILYVWGGSWCTPCRVVWSDWKKYPAFAAAIESRYRVVPVDPRRADPPKRRQIEAAGGYPYFETSDGRSVHGYEYRWSPERRQKHLLTQLGIFRTRPPPRRPERPLTAPEPRPPLVDYSGQIDELADSQDRLRNQIEANDREQREQRGLIGRLQGLRGDLKASLAAAKQRAIAEAKAAARRKAAVVFAEQAAKRPALGLAAKAFGVADGWFGLAKLGLSIVKAAPLGPIGMGAVAVAGVGGLLWRRRRNKRRQRAPPPVTPTEVQRPVVVQPQQPVDEPVPPGVSTEYIGVPHPVEGETKYRYVPVEMRDNWGAAYEEALARYASANPNSLGQVNRIQGMAKAIHDGQKSQSHSVGWKDNEPAANFSQV